MSGPGPVVDPLRVTSKLTEGSWTPATVIRLLGPGRVPATSLYPHPVSTGTTLEWVLEDVVDRQYVQKEVDEVLLGEEVVVQ